MIGYKITLRKKFFKNFNQLFFKTNLLKIGIGLSIIGILSDGLFNGFSLNAFAERAISAQFDEDGSYNHPTMYITYLVSLISLGCAIFIVLIKKSKKASLLFILFSIIGLIIYLIGGFRYRILIMITTIVTTYYLYPSAKKINLKIIIPLCIVLYLGMAIVERTRNYGKGLDLSQIENTDISTVESSEGYIVAALSARSIMEYEFDDLVWLEPIETAIFMPIPRALFPEKPDGSYMRDANNKIIGTIKLGGAMVMFAEAYISFGWFGIILQGLFIGLVCRIFWDNYSRNRQSLGAILLLATFNGFSFVWFSRGYLAQDFITFMYYIIIPIWITRILNFVLKNSSTRRRIS